MNHQIYAEEVKGGNEFLGLTFRATNLDKKVKQVSVFKLIDRDSLLIKLFSKLN